MKREALTKIGLAALRVGALVGPADLARTALQCRARRLVHRRRGHRLVLQCRGRRLVTSVCDPMALFFFVT